MSNVLDDDLMLILKKSDISIRLLDGKSIFITGGTGFFGKWLLEALIFANRSGANVRIGVLSRDPSAFVKTYSHLSNGVKFYKGDIETFVFPTEKYDYIIHAATQASSQMNIDKPWYVFNNIINGTERLLKFAEISGAYRVLHASSGAVYGVQPTDITHVSEAYTGAPDMTNATSAYGEGKRVSELLGTIFSKNTGVEFISARCYSFVGPYLPLDGNYAIGNFLLNGMNSEEILIKGDGTVLRSYMYSADLTIWLFRLLTHGESLQAYNVGSDIVYSIKEVAGFVQNFFPQSDIRIFEQASENKLPERYIPSINKAMTELGLDMSYSLHDALKRTITSCKLNNS